MLARCLPGYPVRITQRVRCHLLILFSEVVEVLPGNGRKVGRNNTDNKAPCSPQLQAYLRLLDPSCPCVRFAVAGYLGAQAALEGVRVAQRGVAVLRLACARLALLLQRRQPGAAIRF